WPRDWSSDVCSSDLPTPAPEDTLLELAKPVFYHRSAEFRQILAEVEEDLQYVYCTRHPVVPLTSSGTGGMEASLVSCVPPGKKRSEERRVGKEGRQG